MRGYFGGFIVIAVSFVLSGVGVYKLYRLKKYLVLLVYVLFFITYPLICWLIYNSDLNVLLRAMPEWVGLTIGVLFVTISIFWYLSGYTIYRIAEDIEFEQIRLRRKNRDEKNIDT